MRKWVRKATYEYEHEKSGNHCFLFITLAASINRQIKYLILKAVVNALETESRESSEDMKQYIQVELGVPLAA